MYRLLMVSLNPPIIHFDLTSHLAESMLAKFRYSNLKSKPRIANIQMVFSATYFITIRDALLLHIGWFLEQNLPVRWAIPCLFVDFKMMWSTIGLIALHLMILSGICFSWKLVVAYQNTNKNGFLKYF